MACSQEDHWRVLHPRNLPLPLPPLKTYLSAAGQLPVWLIEPNLEDCPAVLKDLCRMRRRAQTCSSEVAETWPGCWHLQTPLSFFLSVFLSFCLSFSFSFSFSFSLSRALVNRAWIDIICGSMLRGHVRNHSAVHGVCQCCLSLSHMHFGHGSQEMLK